MLKRVSGQEYQLFVAAMVGSPGFFRATASDIKLTDTGLVENCTEEMVYSYGGRQGEEGATIIGLRSINGDHWISGAYSWIPNKTKANKPIKKTNMGIKNTVLTFFKR